MDVQPQLEHARRCAFVFPGQGSQSVGMGFSLISKFADFEPIFLETLREADSAIGFSLSTVIKDGPADRLKQTDITQPALLTVSTAMGRYLKMKGRKADFALGHSLGEYSALVFAESISFMDAVQIVHLRGKLMQSAVPSGRGGMAALVGADRASAEKVCARVRSEIPQSVLEPSAFNCPGQVVISGTMEAIDLACKVAKDAGIRAAMKLEVSGPFHSSLLAKAGDQLFEALEKIQITAPSIPVISNTTAKIERTPAEIRENLKLQVSKAVLWEDSVREALTLGADSFLEVGSGKVLNGLIKKIASNLSSEEIQTMEGLNNL